MLFYNLYDLAGILVFLGLLRYWLLRSNLNSVLAVSLGCALTFCFFDNFFCFLPVVFCLLKGKKKFSQVNPSDNQIGMSGSTVGSSGKQVALTSNKSDWGNQPWSATPLEEAIQKFHH